MEDTSLPPTLDLDEEDREDYENAKRMLQDAEQGRLRFAVYTGEGRKRGVHLDNTNSRIVFSSLGIRSDNFLRLYVVVMGKRPKVRRDLFWQPAGEDERYKFNSHVALISVADGEDCGFHTTTYIGDELYAYCGPEAESWWKANERRIRKGL